METCKQMAFDAYTMNVKKEMEKLNAKNKNLFRMYKVLELNFKKGVPENVLAKRLKEAEATMNVYEIERKFGKI